MTTPAAAATSGPIASAAPRPAPQAAADPFAFGAVLDSLPGTSAKADASTIEEGQPPSNESPQEESSRGQTTHHSLLNGSALLAALPFALRAASTMHERRKLRERVRPRHLTRNEGPKSEDTVHPSGLVPRRRPSDDWSATRFSLWPLHVRRRNRAARSGSTRHSRQGQLAADLTARSAQRRKQPCRRFLRPRLYQPNLPARFRRLQTRRPTTMIAPALAHPQHIALTSLSSGARAARIQAKPDVSASACARVATSAVHALWIERKDGDGRPQIRLPRGAISRANRPFGAQLQRLSPLGRRSNRQLNASADADVTRARACSPQAPRPRRRRSARSTSIFAWRPEDVSMTMRRCGRQTLYRHRAARTQTLGQSKARARRSRRRMAAIGQPPNCSSSSRQVSALVEWKETSSAEAARREASSDRRKAQRTGGSNNRYSARRWSRS